MRLYWFITLIATFLTTFAYAQYQTVNARPQAVISEDGFSLYWGIWRTLLPLERLSAKSLITRREISWSVESFDGQSLLHDYEHLYFLDPVSLDSSGALVPIPEAPRTDYFYFSLLNFNSRFAKGLGPFLAPKRDRNEQRTAYLARKKQAFAEWLRLTSIVHTKGTVKVRVIQRVFMGKPLVGEFFNLRSTLPQELQILVNRQAPDRWPIYHDEKSHKAFSSEQPALWSEARSMLASSVIEMDVHWDWCGTKRDVWIEMPAGSQFEEGPTRDGRTDAGSVSIPIIIR